MNSRERRAARRRALRKAYPVCTEITVPGGTYGGCWVVYGHKGQGIYIRRAGMSSGYFVHIWELAGMRVGYKP